MLLRVGIAITERLRELTDRSHRDRGEGPVPYVVMVVLIAIGAVAVAGIIVAAATDWTDSLPDAP